MFGVVCCGDVLFGEIWYCGFCIINLVVIDVFVNLCVENFRCMVMVVVVVF